MKSQKPKILTLGILILVSQLFIFRDYIMPIQWGQIKVSGLACTCPDEKVVNGRFYLRSITPDSLKQFDLDYSEIYVSERPATKIDPMGADLYMIKGKVIGKDRVSSDDPWNPILQVESWKEVDILIDWAIKILFVIQILILSNLVRSKTNSKH